jgi:glycosyltransferase involved in cell wall biosynthesis
MLASILIVNYNNAPLIKRCIDSVLNQSYQDIEVIIVDDSSTDNSLNEINKFKSKIKILKKKKNKTQIQAFDQIESYITAFNGCSGDVIFFLDSDDFFKKDKISKVMKIFNRDKTKKFILDQPIFKFKSKEIEKKYRKSLSKRKWPKFPPTSCMCFEKKTLINSIKKLDLKNFPNLGLDFRLAVYYHIILNNFYILDSHYTIYRQLTGSVDHKYRKKFFSKNWWKRRDEAFEFLNKLLKKNNIRTNNGLDYLITKLFNKILNK